MQQQYPFTPRGGASGTASAAVGATNTAIPLPAIPAEGCSIRLVNAGTQLVQVSFNGTATANSMPLLANTSEVFSIAPGMSLNALATATGSTLYATLGDGM